MIGHSTLRDGYIHVVDEHVSDIDDVITRMREAGKLMKSSGVRRLFVDSSYALEIWRVAKIPDLVRSAKRYIPEAERVAILRGSWDDADVMPQLIDALNAAGIHAQIFSNSNSAHKWLVDP
jgi:hypothetical protein